MNESQAATKHTLQIGPKAKRTIEHLRAQSVPGAAKGNPAVHSPRYLFRAWGEIADRLRDAKTCALLLDFDGTLVKLQRRPWEVRVPQRTKRLLQRLARHPRLFVAIVSGRRCLDLQTRVGVEALHFIGLHGAERERITTKITKAAARILARAQHGARKRMAAMRGMRIEDKGMSFAVHYREASAPIARAAKSCLLDVVEPHQETLRVLDGAMVWEVLPNEIRGKGGAVLDLLSEFPPGTPAIYIGDDGTDETAFCALGDQITIRVGKPQGSAAKYYVRDPGEVIRFLLQLEAELAQR
jgi:trehalose 6-phosphate phosphatase